MTNHHDAIVTAGVDFASLASNTACPNGKSHREDEKNEE